MLNFKNKKTLVLLAVLVLGILALISSFVLQNRIQKGAPATNTPSPIPTPALTPTQMGTTSSPTALTEKRWSDPLGFYLSYVNGVRYLHQNNVTQITPATSQNNFLIKFCLDCSFKCDGDCSQKSTVNIELGSYQVTAKKVYPDRNGNLTLSGNIAYPSSTANKPLSFFVTYANSDDLQKVNQIFQSFRFVYDYKISEKDALDKIENEEIVRDLIKQYENEISVVNLYEDLENKTWVIGVTRQPEDGPTTTVHQYAVDKFTGEVKLLF